MTTALAILAILIIMLVISRRRKDPGDYDNSTGIGYNSRGRRRK